MSSAEEQAQTAAATTEAEAVSLLDQAISATKQTAPDRAQALLKTLTEEALKGTVTFDKNLAQTFQRAIAAIDEKVSKQLNAVMHHPRFQQLEGSWRGMHHLVMNSETSSTLKIRVLNVGKRELYKDLTKAVEFDQSQLFKKIYENEFGTPGGEPYGALIGDYEFTNHPEDVELLSNVSNVAAAAFAPFISAASPKMFGFESMTELSKPRDMEKIFESMEYAKWRSFRESEDSRFVTLTMPRVLARLPYGRDTKLVEEFDYEEGNFDDRGVAKAMDHDEYCWMNSAYVMGTKLTDAFAKYGWCTAIRGAEGGGKVDNLPTHVFTSDDGDTDSQCPTEIGVTDRREAELSKLGFLPLCHYKNTDYAVFFGAQSTQKPKKYDRPEATANAAISARLPYIMATSRFAH
ncbi:MAG: type VI secretion system contractile sheath large subunit, partial [Rhodospirillaceae bacterium]|nr:type VI secretion system contractile sheath large subunit [Rhodospirillaceae bacterium]